MIVGNGIDLIAINRMQKLLLRYEDELPKKILSSEELAEFADNKRKAAFLAKRFAAKEAFLKALGTGLRNGISLKHLTVSHDDLGKPLLRCTARANQLLEQKSIAAIHLSISDETDYAIAMVILESVD